MLALGLWSSPAPAEDGAIAAQELYGGVSGALVGARPAALGGAVTGSSGGGIALWWNPAALADSGSHSGITGGVVGETNDARRYLDVRDAATAVDPAKPSVDDVERFINLGLRGPRDRLGGALPISWAASADVAAQSGSFGIFGVERYAATAQYDVSERFRQGHREIRMNSRAGSLGILETGVSWATRAGELDIGVSPKWIQASYGSAYSSAVVVDTDLSDGLDQNDTTVTQARPPVGVRGAAGAFGLDLGILKRNGRRARVGIVVRNINSPVLRFADGAGMTVDRLRLGPEADVGFSTELDRRVGLGVDFHNVTFADGGGPSLHIGVRCRVSSDWELRFGLNRGRPSFGFGLGPSRARIDAMIAGGPGVAVALGGRIEF